MPTKCQQIKKVGYDDGFVIRRRDVTEICFFAPLREILQRGATCLLDRRFRNQRVHATMMFVTSGVRRTHTATKYHIHVKYASVCITL